MGSRSRYFPQYDVLFRVRRLCIPVIHLEVAILHNPDEYNINEYRHTNIVTSRPLDDLFEMYAGVVFRPATNIRYMFVCRSSSTRRIFCSFLWFTIRLPDDYECPPIRPRVSIKNPHGCVCAMLWQTVKPPSMSTPGRHASGAGTAGDAAVTEDNPHIRIMALPQKGAITRLVGHMARAKTFCAQGIHTCLHSRSRTVNGGFDLLERRLS